MKLGHEGYWNFLKRCEDTGLERMAMYVKQEQDKWFAKYEEQLALWKSQQGASKSSSTCRSLRSRAQVVMLQRRLLLKSAVHQTLLHQHQT